MMRQAPVILFAFVVALTGSCKVKDPPIAPVPDGGPAAPNQKPAPAANNSGLIWIFSKPAGIEFTKSQVTVAQYQACVKAGKCAPAHFDDGTCSIGSGIKGTSYSRGQLPESFQGDDQPLVCVDWNQADSFCEWAGGRLPSEKEWYAEASNQGTRQYPWGDLEPTCDTAVMDQGGKGCGRGSTWPVCSKERGNSVSGLCDMSGNVSEWTATPEGSTRSGPGGSSLASAGLAVHGGPWNSDYEGYFRASYRFGLSRTNMVDNLGFRCGRSSR